MCWAQRTKEWGRSDALGVLTALSWASGLEGEGRGLSTWDGEGRPLWEVALKLELGLVGGYSGQRELWWEDAWYIPEKARRHSGWK